MISTVAQVSVAIGFSTLKGMGNVMIGMYQTVHDFVTAPIDVAMTAYGIFNPKAQWTPLSFAGESYMQGV